MQDSAMDTMQRPSRAITTVVLLVAAVSFGLTSWYLWAGMPITIIHLLMAAVVVVGPLLASWPLSTERALKVALVWAVAGLLGGYVFGAYVFLSAPVLGGSALIVHFLEYRQSAGCSRARCALSTLIRPA